MLTRDVGDGRGAQPVSLDEMIAELHLLSRAGHGESEPGDDQESQEFFGGVERLNPDWKPGQIPRVRPGYQDGRALREQAPFVAKPALARVPSPGRVQVGARAPRSRSVRTSNAKARSPGSSSSDDEPHLEAVPISRFRRDVAAWLEAVHR
jgi:hypothetical protein